MTIVQSFLGRLTTAENMMASPIESGYNLLRLLSPCIMQRTSRRLTGELHGQ